jgi:CSLREA domain-containing protein
VVGTGVAAGLDSADLHGTRLPSLPVSVDTTADEYGAGPDCSLREAIETVNGAGAFGGCSYYGSNTIELPAGTYRLTIVGSGEDNNATGDLDVDGSLTIRGASSGSTIIDGNQLDRVLHNRSGSLTLQDLTITGGRSPNGALGEDGEDGGGIYSVGSGLALDRCVVTANRTGDGGASDGFRTGYGGNGGGVYASGTVTISNSTISGNETGAAGSVSEGYGGSGAGIHAGFGSTVTVSGSTLSDNVSTYTAGGLLCPACALTVVNATISGNQADDWAGGVLVLDDNGSSYYRFSHSTITGNVGDADSSGDPWGAGGILGGSSATPELKATIIAGNTDNSGNNHDDCFFELGSASHGYNLVGSSADCPSGQTGDLETADAMLGALADNDGPTWTHALQTGSPAIDNGVCTDIGGATVGVDQRGKTRPADVTCDIGAYEYNAVPVELMAFTVD